MEKETVVFHSVDRKILESYKSVIEGMAEYMGTAYEFVLHSLEDYDHSVIAIINGQHTGRSVGAPITNLALEMLGKIEHSEHSDHISYFTKNKDGAPLKSTTIAIRGYGNRIIGLICINLYLNTEFDVVIRNFLPANTKRISLWSMRVLKLILKRFLSSPSRRLRQPWKAIQKSPTLIGIRKLSVFCTTNGSLI